MLEMKEGEYMTQLYKLLSSTDTPLDSMIFTLYGFKMFLELSKLSVVNCRAFYIIT